MPINNFDTDDFLCNFWQQKPLLIRNAFTDFNNPLSPEELAGMACEEDIESRLITASDNNWQLQHGPFNETLFQTLPPQDWTLLVQAVDHWVPEVAELLNHFRFIPRWRIDDVMVSYATKGGSVGPHYDNYDVFLLQGAGSRRWQVGDQYHSKSAMLNNNQLKLLHAFDCQQEWLLEAGDMLYLPPRYGHWGIAADNDCMTYSIGFRAPSHAEMLSDFCDHNLQHLTEEKRYSDPHLNRQQNSGEITAETIDKVHSILTSLINDKATLSDWFGRYMTETKYPHIDDNSEFTQFDKQQLTTALNDNCHVEKSSNSRFAFIQTGQKTLFFADRKQFTVNSQPAIKLVKYLADKDRYLSDDIQHLITDPSALKLILSLLNQGTLYFSNGFCYDSDQEHHTN